MTKQEAIWRLASFVLDHLDAGEMWNDEAYKEDIRALAKIGYPRAIKFIKELERRRKCQK
jgi:hypothetical protein